jgi:hypothetical protein
MPDDIERRLAAAAQAIREFEVTGQRCSDLSGREDEIRAELEKLRSRYTEQTRDVERLEHMSLTRVLASLKGARQEALSRERADAEAARYRVADTEARLAAVCGEQQAAQERLDRLASAPDAYKAVLAEKERHLTESADPRRAELLSLASERGRLNAEVGEMSLALQGAAAAREALLRLRDKLGSAKGWNTYDTFFGGGMLADIAEHSRLDEAAQLAAEADQRMAALRTELADLEQTESPSEPLAISAATKFVDLWLGNIFTDLAMRDRITRAQENVTQSLKLVSDVQGQLTGQSAQAQARLAAIETERRGLLTHP